MAPTTHHLHFLENEDEAEMTGMNFEAHEDHVIITQTFHYPEYEQSQDPVQISKPEARKLWTKLLASGQFEEKKSN